MIGAVLTSIYQLAQFTAVGGLKVVMYLVNTNTNTNTGTNADKNTETDTSTNTNRAQGG